MAKRKVPYERMEGVDASHGQKFEMDMTTLVYLRCLRLHEQWKKNGTAGIKSFAVANNVKGAGKFDDIVVRMEYVAEGMVKNKLTFVQCKHLQNPCENFKKKFQTLLSDPNTLKSYLDSYNIIEHCRKNEMNEHFANNTTDTEQNVCARADKEQNNLKYFFNCENLDIELMFYSNIPHDTDCKLFQIQDKVSDYSDPTIDIFNTANSVQQELKLKEHCLPNSTLKDTNSESLKSKKQFCEKLRVFILQSEPAKFIGEEIKLLKNDVFDVENLRDLFVQEVSFNFKTQTQCNALTEKDDTFQNVYSFWDIRKKGVEVCTEFSKKIGTTKIFSCQTIENFIKLLETEKNVVIDTNYQNFETLKVLQLAYSKPIDSIFLFLKDNSDKTKWMISRNTKLYENLKQIYIFSQNIVYLGTETLKPNEFLIQINACSEQKKSLAEYVEQFSTETEQLIINTKVCFQGEYTDIKSFCGDSWKIFFDERATCDIIEKKSIEIQKPLPSLDFYISRTFTKEILKLEFIKQRAQTWNIKSNCIILFSEREECIPGHDASYKVLKNMEEVRKNFKTFVRSDKITYHLCSYANKQLEWIFLFGKSSDYTRQIIIGEDDLLNEIKAKILILTDVAGMGKTTTLLSLARRYKQKNPLHWVLFIELNKYLHLFKNIKESLSIDTAIKFIASTLLNMQKFELDLFTDACNKSGNVALFLDAFDEISPEAEKTFLFLLLALEKTKIRNIIVSSRPNYAQFLEESLLYKSVKFEGLRTEEKEKALEGYWKKMLTEDEATINEDILKGIVKNTLKLLQTEENFLSEILAIPLHIRMVAIVFYKILLKHNSEERNTDTFSINLANLYEQFIHLHAERFYVDKHKVPRNNLRPRQVQDKLKGAEEIACQTIIPKIFQNNEIDRSNEIAALCDDVGIISNQSPIVFLHRTVAEYLTAKYIVREIFSKSRHGVHLQHISYLLMDKTLNIVRKFINHLLIGRTADIFVYYEKKDIENILKEFGKTPVHVSVFERNVEITRCLLASGDDALLNTSNFNGKTVFHRAYYNVKTKAAKLLHLNKDCIVNIRDEYGNTALHDASMIGNVEIIQLLMQREKSLLNMQGNKGRTPLHIACENGTTEAAKLLLTYNDCSVNICDKYGDSVLHVAAFEGYVEIMQLILQRDTYLLLNMQNKKGSTPLNRACFNRNTEAVKFLLSNKDCSVNICDNDGNTVLHLATERDCVKIMQLILNRDQSPLNMQNEEGFTPLHVACSKGKTEAAKFLLSYNDCSVNICDEDGDTVFHVASSNGYVEAMQLILQRDPSLLNIQNYDGNTALHYACYNGNTEAMKWLLSLNDCLVHICDKHDDTVLHACSWKGNVEIMQLILKRDQSPLNMQNKEGLTPLHVACSKGKTEAAKLFLSYQECSVNIYSNDCNTVLHLATETGCVEIMQLILKRDQSPLNMQNKEGFTPLHLACSKGKTEAAKFLLSYNDCSVNICDEDGDTVFHVASLNGYVETMQLILQRDPSLLNIQNYDGNTALHYACYNGNTEAMKWLLSLNNCLVNICDKDDDTVLHAASWKGNVEIMQLILKRDQSPLNMKNKRGFTPLHWAYECGKTVAVEFLLSHADCSVNIRDKYGDSVLHKASNDGDLKTMQLILKLDQPPLNLQNNMGWTPLHGACFRRRKEAVKLLLSQPGCSLTIRSRHTPLDIARLTGHEDIIELLLQHRANERRNTLGNRLINSVSKIYNSSRN